MLCCDISILHQPVECFMWSSGNTRVGSTHRLDQTIGNRIGRAILLRSVTVRRPNMETKDFGLITIDGSQGEGGGQILRNAISYANILRKEIVIRNIRAGRIKPGLKAQHVTGLQLATAVCGGSLQGDQINSTEINYRPVLLSGTTGQAHTRYLKGEIGTAGSICLLLQAALPCALFSTTQCNMVLKGGTNATMAPQYDYWERVFLPTIQDQCALDPDQVQAFVCTRGYFPTGGGKVQVHVKPLERLLRPIKLTEKGEVREIFIRSFHAGKIPQDDAEQMAKAAESFLQERVKHVVFQTEIVTERDAVGTGMGILIVAMSSTGCRLAGSALSSPEKTAHDIGIEAAQELLQTIEDGGCVDDWLQDQLILFAALAGGVSEILTGSLTMHTKTAICIAEEMTGAKFEVTKLDKGEVNALVDTDYGKDGRVSGRHLIRCHGIGFAC